MAAAVLVIGVVGPAGAVDKILSGSTGTTSSHYVYAVSAGKSINSTVGDKINITIVSTGGAVDNLERINRGQLKMGLGTWATFFQAYKGMGKYKGDARTKLRALWLYTYAAQNYVVRADSGINDLNGLIGKKYCAGMRGSATEQVVQQILDAVGIKPDYFRASLADAVAAVKDNRIAGYTKAGAGLALDATTKELKAFTKIKILNWPPDKVAKVQQAMPFVNFTNVPEGTAPGIPAYTTPVQCIGFVAYSDSLTEEQAYQIVKGIHDGKKYQEAAYPAIKGFDIAENTMKFTKFPLHKGAIRYFREIGVQIPANLIPPEAK
jgi:TRAP transporter TAXI family solute receptor